MLKRSMHSLTRADHHSGLLSKMSLPQTIKTNGENDFLEKEEMKQHQYGSAVVIERENILLKRKLAERDHEITILKQLLLYK